MVDRRLLLAGIAATSGVVLFTGTPGDQTSALTDSAIGTLLLLGFTGTTAASDSALALASHIAAGRAAGAFFVKGNVGSREDVAGLVRLFVGAASPKSVIIAIDHEGGAVQRLSERHGFTRLPAALEVANTKSVEDAYSLYATAGQELAALGFTTNLAPVVDLHDSENPAIGHYGRCFTADPHRVAAYAKAFIDGFASAGIICVAKHFPGAGSAHSDSHITVPDVSGTWTRRDLEPYRILMAQSSLVAIMTAHLRAKPAGADAQPATLSRGVVTDLLRTEVGFSGVAVTDDLDMLAENRRAALLKALAAGGDLVLIRNDSHADTDLPIHASAWIRDGVAAGQLSADRLLASASRVRRLRQLEPA